MTGKGLCSTCLNQQKCALSRKPPVLQCEEFTTAKPQANKRRRANRKN